MQSLRFFSLLVFFVSIRCGAFALLGPLQSWQIPILGYDIRDEVGGPQNLGEEYRWNVPVITYAFDSSFVEFFGTNGERAVEEALGMITNALGGGVSTLSPLLEEFPLRGKNRNQRAAMLNLLDLKTYALGFILEEMGLAGPEKNSWVLRGRSITADTPPVTNYLRITRNFDPIDFAPTSYVNGVFYTSEVIQISFNPEAYDAFEFPADPTKPYLTSAASIIAGYGPGGFPHGGAEAGEYFSSLTRDDVGGLRYLLSTNNVNMEDILPDITGVGSTSIVHAAPRPGLNKISFQRFSKSDGTLNNTNTYLDTFLRDGIPQQQQLRRTSIQPDITFFASDLGTCESFDTEHRFSRRADWLNGIDTDGPGIIKPGIQIIFGKIGLGPHPESYNPRWGSFDDSTSIEIFPAGPSYQIPNTFRLTPLTNETNSQFLWELNGIAGVDYRIEKSDDLQLWTSITNINATNGTFSFQFESSRSNSNSFYRALRN